MFVYRSMKAVIFVSSRVLNRFQVVRAKAVARRLFGAISDQGFKGQARRRAPSQVGHHP